MTWPEKSVHGEAYKKKRIGIQLRRQNMAETLSWLLVRYIKNRKRDGRRLRGVIYVCR